MADEIDKEIIKLGFDLDPRKAVSEISKFQKTLSKKMVDAEKSTKKLDKGFLKFIKQLKSTREQSRGVKTLTQDFTKLGKSADKDVSVLKAMIKTAKGLSGEERKAAVARIREQRRASGHGAKRAAMGGIRKHAEAVKNSDMFDIDSLREEAEHAGNSLAEPLREVMAKDAPALFKRATGILAKGMMSAGRLGSGAGNLGGWAKKHGDKMMAKGGMASVAGAGLKGIEKISSSLGPVISMFTKLGPIISVASGFLMAFVKILVDAEAGAKEYNKQLLATTGTARYLKSSFGNIGKASKELDKSLRAARDGAMNWSNIQMGITKETALAFQNALTAEGVSLDRLSGSTRDATKMAQEHARQIQMGVVYARSFGVSLSEVTQLQGELMGNLGVGAKQVHADFQQIINSASEAGMETNKFFGIVRSFSSDLSLFALRMADVAKVIGVLGKSMDPRNAQKFLQNLSQKFGGGTADNLKYEVIAGQGATHDILKREVGDKINNLRGDLKAALGPGKDKEVEALINLIKNPKTSDRQLLTEVAKYDGLIAGGVEEAVSEIRNMNRKVASQDPIDAASVMELLSPLGKMEVLEKAALKLTGQGFDKLSGLNLLAVEQAGIASAKEVREYQKFSQAITLGQEQLIRKVESGAKLSDQEQRQVQKLLTGVGGPGSDADKLKTVLRNDKVGGAKKFYDSMGSTQKELLQDSLKEREYQKEIADQQTSLVDTLGMIGDFLMNEIYGIMHDIWQVITDIYMSLPWVGGSKKDAMSAKSFAQESGIPALVKAFQNSDVNKASDQAISTVGREVIGQVQAAVKEYRKLSADIKNEKDPGKRKEMAARAAQLRPALNYDGKDEKYLKGVSRDKGVHLMVARLIEMKKAVDKVPGLGKPGTTATTAAVAATDPTTAPAVAAASNRSNSKPPTEGHQQATTDSVKDLERTVADKGVKIDPSTINGPLSDEMAKSVYEGASRALFEYYMYSSLNQTSVSAAMSKGISPAAIAQSMTNTTGATPSAALANLMSPNAEGGVVSGIANGMARVSRFPPAPAGEGWASVGRGEKIMPAGAGGGTTKVELELKGDFRRFINARIVEGAAAHDRNKRFR